MFDSLPIGWEKTTIGKVTRSFAGGTPSRSMPEYYGPGIPWLKSGEVRAGRIESTEESITELGLKESSARIARAGTPVVAMYGATAGQAGILAIDAAMNQAVLAVVPVPAAVDAEFCYQFLRSNTAKLLDRTQGSGQPNLSKSLIDGLEIQLPPLDEQRRIAEVLRSVDEVASRSRSVMEQAENCLTDQLSTLMRRGLRSGSATKSDVPETWKTGRCDFFFVLQRGFDITETQASPGPYRVVSSSGPAYWHSKSAVAGPAVITGRKGRLGTVFYSEEPCWPHDTTLWVKDFKGNFPRFIYWKLTDMKLNTHDAATSVPTLNRNNVHALIVSLPSIDEQIEIARVLDSTSDVIEVQREHLNALLNIRAMAMSDLLSGRVRVTA